MLQGAHRETAAVPLISTLNLEDRQVNIVETCWILSCGGRNVRGYCTCGMTVICVSSWYETDISYTLVVKVVCVFDVEICIVK